MRPTTNLWILWTYNSPTWFSNTRGEYPLRFYYYRMNPSTQEFSKNLLHYHVCDISQTDYFINNGKKLPNVKDVIGGLKCVRATT